MEVDPAASFLEGPADKPSSRRRDDDRSHRSHRHHHRSSGHHRDSKDRSRSRERRHHHHKRRRRDEDEETDGERHRRRHRKSRRESEKPAAAPADEDDSAEGEWVEAAMPLPPNASTDGAEIPSAVKYPATITEPTLKRDSWMMEPSADDIDYTQKGVKKAVPEPIAKPDYRPVIHKNELNEQLKQGKSLGEYADSTDETKAGDVNYTFGDQGSKWRMTKLRRTYEAAKEEGKEVEEVAIARYGDLRFFDDAREEEMELERREVYGTDRKDSKEKPTGDLYKERLAKQRVVKERLERRRQDIASQEQGRVMSTEPNRLTTTVLDQTALNKMQAALMKAKMKGDPKADDMEREYNAALAASSTANKREPEVVVLSAMDNRMLAGMEGRVGRDVVKGKGGKLVENEDMSLDDMVRHEKMTKGQGEGKVLAERIQKDVKFDDNLDYLDENAAKLAQRVHKNEVSLKNTAIHEFKKMQHILDTCPLCSHEKTPPIAPIVSLATRVFLTLPTEPEISQGGAVIVPIQHRTNMMECDDDEWEEVRNFMKSLIRMYSSQGRDVIFYENAAAPHRRKHAAIQVVPLPPELGETAPAYFKEAILSSDAEWSQHQKIINTLAKARDGLGKMAFRKTLVKEMPYFHVWFEPDGGMGHVIEDEARWPKGDLFAREVLGGMLDCEPQVIKRQGRWQKGGEKRRVEGFREAGWEAVDWTKVLMDA